ncbi:MAG: hypothetical protein LUH15_18580 [Tannerellaceae bacterium]|nr:hypothetical protein [Tannerellaceae bacterium]
MDEDEKKKLNNSIISDYQFLTKSISSIYSQILMTQMESASVNTGYVLDSVIHDTKHDLRKIQEVTIDIINQVSNKYKDKSIKLIKKQTEIDLSITRIKDRWEDFQKNVDNDDILEFDIGNYSKILLEGIKNNNSYSVNIEYEFVEGYKLRFSQPLLYSIYFNVLMNIDHIMKANNKTDGKVHFRISQKNGIFYLCVEDNCGGIDDFKKVVDLINSNQHYGKRLHGLEIIKRRILYLMNIDNNWELEQDEVHIHTKRLLIPLAHYKEV